MMNIHGNNFSEKRGVTTNKTFSFAGRGCDAQPIFAEFETKFSIARGVIKDHEWTGRYFTEDGNEYKGFVRV